MEDEEKIRVWRTSAKLETTSGTDRTFVGYDTHTDERWSILRMIRITINYLEIARNVFGCARERRVEESEDKWRLILTEDLKLRFIYKAQGASLLFLAHPTDLENFQTPFPSIQASKKWSVLFVYRFDDDSWWLFVSRSMSASTGKITIFFFFIFFSIDGWTFLIL